MRLVYQTDWSENGADCVAACVATLLGTDISAVPKLRGVGGGLSTALDPWLKKFGLRWAEFRIHEDGAQERIASGCLYMPSGPSPGFAGDWHSCLYAGRELAHDPARRIGLTEIVWVSFPVAEEVK